MRRRALITLAAGAAAAWSGQAAAQQAPMPAVGTLFIGSADSTAAPRLVEAIRRGLAQMGFVEGRTVAFEHRWADGRQERLPELAADLVRRRVSVICTTSNIATLAAKGATSDIPIVFVVGLDPVAMGVVAAINRPGGNATGVSVLTSALEPKRVQLIHDLLPGATLLAALVNPDNPNAASHTTDLQAAARSLGLTILILGARHAGEFDTAFATIKDRRAGALLLTSDPVFDGQRQHLVELAARGAVPAIYPWRDFADIGGLLSYGPSLTDAARQVGVYAGRILRGVRPTDLPVWQPTRFEMVVNLKTAQTLGLTIPPTIMAAADEVIE